ncbi:MAG: hypothetical protein ABFS38_14730 [Bacteroidota bacterium]
MDGKSSISFLLLACFSVFLGHNIVPHHHHTESVNCEHHPMHCHAFNGVDFIKYSHSDLKQPVKIIPALTLSVSKMVLEPPSMFESQQYICLKLPDKTTRFRGAISMRAPPVSA